MWCLRPELGSNLAPSFRLLGRGALSWAGPGAACSVLDSSTSCLGEVTETKAIEICNLIPRPTGRVQAPKPQRPPHYEALPSPSGAQLLRVYPQQTGASRVWESHVWNSPAVVEEFKSGP